MIGVGLSTVHDIETGRRKPSFTILIRLLFLFGKIELAEDLLVFLDVSKEEQLVERRKSTVDFCK